VFTREPTRPIPLLLFLACVFFWGSIPQVGYAEQPTVEEILKKVAEKYQSLQTYQFVAERVIKVTSVSSSGRYGGSLAHSDSPKPTVTSEIMLAVGNRGKFHLEVKEEAGSVVAVSDGQTKWTYMSQQKQYTEEAVTSGAADQTESGNAHPDFFTSYRHLLVDRYRGLSQYGSTAVLEKEDELNVGGERVVCYVIQIKTPQGENEFWVDKDRYIVWRSINVGKEVAALSSFERTIMFNVAEIKVNVDPAESLFQFTPPKKAVKVSSLK
jgi:outer membrane lipoprotein-sorting protein